MEHKFCIAPMLDKTDRHFRYIARLLTRHAVLYTEMITTGAILKGDRDYHLRYHADEHPLALQLGGSDPYEMSECASIAQDYGYDEININVGCPSDRVQNGMFGACLMAKPELVAECVDSMRTAVALPITVKHRIGIDDLDSYESLHAFVSSVAQAGCDTFIIHARKAWLQGLSPRENREIPPLDYNMVYRVKSDFPKLEIIINGGIKTIEESLQHLQHVDGVMLGRETYNNSYLLAGVDARLYGETAAPISRRELLLQLLPYIEQEIGTGTRLHNITRHLHGLLLGMPGARQWRRMLSPQPPLELDSFRQMIMQMPEVD